MKEHNITKYSQAIPTVFTAYGFAFFAIGIITMIRPVWFFSVGAYSPQSEFPLMLLGLIMATFGLTLLYTTILRKDVWLKPLAIIATIIATATPIMTQFHVFTFDRLADQLNISRTILSVIALILITTPAVYSLVSMRKMK